MCAIALLPYTGSLAAQAPAAAAARDASLVPPAALTAEGIPPIPAALAGEVRRYTESRSAGVADWHPLRRELLISTRFGATAQLHRVAMPMGARTQLTFQEEPVGGGTWDPVRGDYLLFGKDQGGNEFAQLYRLDMADGRITLLTGGGRTQNGGASWSTKGDRIAYASTRRNGTDRDIRLMDPRDPATDRLVMENAGGGWGVQDWSPDDRTLLVGEYRSVNESRLWLVDVATGARTRLTPERREPTVYGDGRFTPDGTGLWLVTDEGSEWQRLAYMDLATRRITPVELGARWDVETIALSADGRTLAVTTNEAGISRLRLLDTRTRAVREVTGLPAGVIGGVRWHRRLNELAVSINSARSPSDVYSIDARTLAVARWTESELGGLVASQLAEPRLVTWTSFDGREISGFLYPASKRFSGRRPVLINIHGGPEGQSRPTFIGRGNYFTNELGIAVLYPNVRGSTGYGKTFVALDNGMKREDSVRDIGALLDWIARQPELDASRVMVTGGSYGGYMTLAVATMYDDRIAASLDVVGISNFNTFLKNTESYRRDLRRAEYGDEREPAMAEFFERTAPLNRAGQITKPLFVVQGANDPRVPRTEADQMVARVRRNGTPVWYLLAADEGHGFQKKPNQDFQFYATVSFMRRYLAGEALP